MTVRAFDPADLEQIVALSLRAWEPIFNAWRGILGEPIYQLAFPQWQRSQADAVASGCTQHAATTVVAEVDGHVTGFAVAIIGEARDDGVRQGDLDMIAVDPAVQRCGTGTALMEASMTVMREHGCALANIWTGGDVGHAPARALYESGGFAPLPVVHYYRAL